jgi:enoyl-CoA hydratase/carnithine racemase
MPDLVLVERHGPVAVVVLNRPERHNSLIPELLQELLDRLGDVAVDADVRAVVLAAEGPSFSTGGDVSSFYDQGDEVPGYAAHIVGLLNDTILTMIDLPKPIVAAVHGMVTGGSLGLVLACDTVLVADEASFTPWYGVVGYSPDGGWTAMLPALIGHKRASELILRNHTITANESVTWGLATAVVPGIGIREEAVALAEEIAEMVPGSVRNAKALLWGDRDALEARLEDERARFVHQIATEEAREGMARFLDRLRGR